MKSRYIKCTYLHLYPMLELPSLTGTKSSTLTPFEVIFTDNTSKPLSTVTRSATLKRLGDNVAR